MFNLHQEVANYLAVRNRKRAEQETGGPLPELNPNVPQPRRARLLALVRRIAIRRPESLPRRQADALRAERC